MLKNQTKKCDECRGIWDGNQGMGICIGLNDRLNIAESGGFDSPRRNALTRTTVYADDKQAGSNHCMSLMETIKKAKTFRFWLDAESGGFEPPVRFDTYDSLANCWFKPLTQPS